MSELLTVNIIEKASKQKIWQIDKNYSFYGTKKNFYFYDFGLIVIVLKDGSIQKYCNRSGNADILITYQPKKNYYRMAITDRLQNEIVQLEDIDSILMYFEKRSQALLAVSTSVTFEKTGIFINSVYCDDIPSLREEAMTFAYLMDHTNGILQLFDNNPFLYERESSIYE